MILTHYKKGGNEAAIGNMDNENKHYSPLHYFFLMHRVLKLLQPLFRDEGISACRNDGVF